MKTINAATDQNNTASFFIDADGDIFDTLEEASEVSSCVAEIVVDGLYVGSLDEMRAAALRKYQAAVTK